MSTAQSEGKGVLVIHADGAAAWLSPLAPAVAGVRVGVGIGAVIEVDAANPASVLGWGLQADGDAAAMAEALNEPSLVQQLSVLAGTADDVFVKSAPVLTDPWVRRATVAAVEQCTVRPINEPALLLDKAAADHGTGRTASATHLFRMGAPSLLDFGEDCLSGAITGGAATDVATIAGIAARSLENTGWETEVRELAARLDSHVGVSDGLLQSLLEEWSPALVAGNLNVSVGTQEVVTKGFYVDPIAVPARLLAWSGGSNSDLTVTWKRGSNSAVVSAELAESTDARSSGAQELIAYASDPRAGIVVAIAPMVVDGRKVHATFDCDREPGTLSFGVYHSETDIASLRLDLLGRTLAMVDRLMRDAYSHHRYASAAVHSTPTMTDLDAVTNTRNTHLSRARHAADNASVLIEDLLDENDNLDDATVTLLNRRRDAIDGYAESLVPGEVPVAGAETLLSEIVRADVSLDDFED